MSRKTLRHVHGGGSGEDGVPRSLYGELEVAVKLIGDVHGTEET